MLFTIDFTQVWARKKFVPTPNTTPERLAKRRRLDGNASSTVMASDTLSVKLKAITAQMPPPADSQLKTVKVQCGLFFKWKIGFIPFYRHFVSKVIDIYYLNVKTMSNVPFTDDNRIQFKSVEEK